MAGGRGQSELREIQSVRGSVVDSVGAGADSQVRGDRVLGRSEIEGELDFRVAWSSLPASFERAGGGCGGMVARKRVSGCIEGFGQILRREIVQTKKNDRVLNCWWFWLGGLDGGSGRSRGNNGGLKIFSSRCRQMLPRRQPLIEFGVTRDGTAENSGLQFREFELLAGDRVVGVQSGFRERDLIVLPAEIAESKQTVAGEPIQGPLAVSLEFKQTGAQLAAAGDGRDFSEVELGLVRALKMRTAEVRDLAAG